MVWFLQCVPSDEGFSERVNAAITTVAGPHLIRGLKKGMEIIFMCSALIMGTFLADLRAGGGAAGS